MEMRLHLVQNIHPLHLTEKCVRILMKSNLSEENFGKKCIYQACNKITKKAKKQEKTLLTNCVKDSQYFCNVFKLKSSLLINMWYKCFTN